MSTATGNWRVRHEGSPRSVDHLLPAQIVEGLRDGLWEATDEVRGPGDTEWRAIENHPVFEEIAADLEPPPSRTYDDETRLDMNALIDVCLVLLIFFILTTSYAVLQKRLEQGSVEEGKVSDVPVLKPADVEHTMVYVKVTMAEGKPVIQVDRQAVPLAELPLALARAASGTTKSQLLLESDDDVPHGVIVEIQDAASQARLSRVRFVVPKGK